MIRDWIFYFLWLGFFISCDFWLGFFTSCDLRFFISCDLRFGFFISPWSVIGIFYFPWSVIVFFLFPVIQHLDFSFPRDLLLGFFISRNPSLGLFISCDPWLGFFISHDPWFGELFPVIRPPSIIYFQNALGCEYFLWKENFFWRSMKLLLFWRIHSNMQKGDGGHSFYNKVLFYNIYTISQLFHMRGGGHSYS